MGMLQWVHGISQLAVRVCFDCKWCQKIEDSIYTIFHTYLDNVCGHLKVMILTPGCGATSDIRSMLSHGNPAGVRPFTSNLLKDIIYRCFI